MNETQTQGAYDPYSWFTEFQRDCVFRNGIVPEWFHGIISRKTAEEMLLFKPIGNFLIRVSESRIGYTLSYRGTDRCRHFMIDVLKDNNYIIVGEDTRYRSLQDLVKYHQSVPIEPFNETLTGACGQVSNEKANYAELLYPKRQHMNPSLLPKMNRDPNLTPMEDIPPSLPHRSNTFIDAASPLSNTIKPPVTTIYTCLETVFNPLSPQSPSMVNHTAKPLPLPRIIHKVSKAQPDQPAAFPTKIPTKPPRKIKSSAALEASAELRAECTDRAQTQPIVGQQDQISTKQKSQEVKSVVSNLIHLKNKFLKKRSVSEEHMYAEISNTAQRQDQGKNMYAEISNTVQRQDQGKNMYAEISNTVQRQDWGKHTFLEEHSSVAPAENDYQTLSGEVDYISQPISLPDDGFPPEYLHPPPFAPGY